ncbi:1-acyl-sn-glycerol-3-phosphate acyltransferase [Pseudactinotalea sp. Z1748]|uniref:1-acyl-sn-glycerol-3-phosphate acyltransferase n=1 Tax=Pseudactinotalea sp. Z1748 TaxID=3413027 RepID=UPI003C7C12DD
MPVPPRWVRRLVIAPAVVLVTIGVLATLPVLVLVALALTSLVPGYFRLPRVLWLTLFYLTWNSAALITMLGLWLGSGFGWKIRTPAFQRAHYVVAARFLRALFRQARWVLRLRITLHGDTPDSDSFGRQLAPGRPLIVASRHAGPGDSLVLIHTLMNTVSRDPRIVLKETLQWDPAIDVMLNRLPNRFIAPAPFTPDGRPRESVLRAQIADLARGLDHDDAFVIFPEGGNFSPQRRERRIARLRSMGLEQMARRAEAMQHVLAPYPGGMLAAMQAAPDADVVFIAHTGLDRMVSVGDLYRELPMDKEIIKRGWHVPAEQIPAGEEARQDWLYTWFETIDAWVQEHRPRDLGPPRQRRRSRPARPRKRSRRPGSGRPERCEQARDS